MMKALQVGLAQGHVQVHGGFPFPPCHQLILIELGLTPDLIWLDVMPKTPVVVRLLEM